MDMHEEHEREEPTRKRPTQAGLEARKRLRAKQAREDARKRARVNAARRKNVWASEEERLI